MKSEKLKKLRWNRKS